GAMLTRPGLMGRVSMPITWIAACGRAAKNRMLTHLLPALGLYSMGLFLVGTVAYDAIAPSNPTKPTWDLGQDFIALYLREFGLMPLIAESLKQGALLLTTFLAGGYLASRFLITSDESSISATHPQPINH
ncbi:MAG: hypothetical protein ACE5EC_07310, partial [Phycisphaerae bacterium]